MYRIIFTLCCIILLTISFNLHQISAGQVVVGYYPAWNRYEYPAEYIATTHLTHVCHAFAWPEIDGSISTYGTLDYPDLIKELHEDNKKILISMGGWGNSYGFSQMANDPASRRRFIQELIDHYINAGYDGIDIDWEHPSSVTERNNLNLLIYEIRQEFNSIKPSLLITMAVSAGSWSGQWYDYTFLKTYVDWFGCMTYDFHGEWSGHSGHNAPLYSPGNDQCGSVETARDYLIRTRGLPENKVLIGIPFYGKAFNANRLYAPFTGSVTSYSYTYIHGLIGNGWTRYWDDVSQVPFLLNNSMTKLITYDDTMSVRLKCEYVLENDLRGVIIWALGQDLLTFTQPLLETVGKSFENSMAVDTYDNENTSFKINLSNYPNPFNSSTMIAFFIPHGQRIKLEIFDINGRNMGTLIDSYYDQGYHEFRFDAKHLPAGVYFTRLILSNCIEVNKLIHLK
ncbi:T9SS type A sorting domain-containing protein [candidate division KSB1 bacterium]|nr:T9SS type A sorting domain-containing protein [candidate division KSB1 bacterium]